jgi:hypothetical protein
VYIECISNVIVRAAFDIVIEFGVAATGMVSVAGSSGPVTTMSTASSVSVGFSSNVKVPLNKCPRCATEEYCEIRDRQLLQCWCCRYQSSRGRMPSLPNPASDPSPRCDALPKPPDGRSWPYNYRNLGNVGYVFHRAIIYKLTLS